MLNKYSTETLEAAAITSNLGNSARRENDTQFEFSGGLFKNLLVSKNDDKGKHYFKLTLHGLWSLEISVMYAVCNNIYADIKAKMENCIIQLLHPLESNKDDEKYYMIMIMKMSRHLFTEAEWKELTEEVLRIGLRFQLFRKHNESNVIVLNTESGYEVDKETQLDQRL
uniref:Uncharacterized protein n=1 Tax=Rhizophagus irregularis (strain DAOM 181602 / DAOM 197198 / MUCL 43194) TaxID=747089 RepID=U9UTC3_RHIID